MENPTDYDVVMLIHSRFSLARILLQMKEVSVRLAQLYMKRVSGELDKLAGGSDKEPLREFLLVQGVRFAFRVHQVS